MAETPRKRPSYLKHSVATAPTVGIPASDGRVYDFQLFPFGEQGVQLEPGLIQEISNRLLSAVRINFHDFHAIIAPEPGGHTWGMLLASRLECGLHIIRNREAVIKGEFVVTVKNGYTTRSLCFPHNTRGHRVILVDDVLSTGLTASAIVETLKSQGVEVVGIVVIYDKTNVGVRLSSRFGLPVIALETSQSKSA